MHSLYEKVVVKSDTNLFQCHLFKHGLNWENLSLTFFNCTTTTKKQEHKKRNAALRMTIINFLLHHSIRENIFTRQISIVIETTFIIIFNASILKGNEKFNLGIGRFF